jgi:hypothetical protein
VSAPQPLTGDELATIKARAEAVDEGPGDYDVRDILRRARTCVLMYRIRSNVTVRNEENQP